MALGLGPLGILFLSAASTCAILGVLLTFQEIGLINRKLPEDQRVGYWGGHPAKSLRIRQEYRRLYPAGRIEAVKKVLAVLMFIFLALTLMETGFFSR